jgi:hypothetical protein
MGRLALTLGLAWRHARRLHTPRMPRLSPNPRCARNTRTQHPIPPAPSRPASIAAAISWQATRPTPAAPSCAWRPRPAWPSTSARRSPLSSAVCCASRAAAPRPSTSVSGARRPPPRAGWRPRGCRLRRTASLRWTSASRPTAGRRVCLPAATWRPRDLTHGQRRGCSPCGRWAGAATQPRRRRLRPAVKCAAGSRPYRSPPASSRRRHCFPGSRLDVLLPPPPPARTRPLPASSLPKSCVMQPRQRAGRPVQECRLVDG